MHVSEKAPVPGSAAQPEPALLSVYENMRVPAHADMPLRAEAEQQGPAPLQAPINKTRKRVTRDRRISSDQESADSGRAAKRRAAHCDETADAPQPKRQRGEPNEPDTQQASKNAPALGNSAAPAPTTAEAPCVARDPSANLTVCP